MHNVYQQDVPIYIFDTKNKNSNNNKTNKQIKEKTNTLFAVTNDHIYIWLCTHTVYNNNHKAIASVTIHENI